MSQKCARCKNKLCVSKVPIFSDLSHEELTEIIRMTGHNEYKKGEDIFLEGISADTLYLINEGQIKIYKYTKDGKEQILNLLNEGEFFGELNLLKEGQYHFNATALSDAKLCSLSKERMKRIILEKPEIGLKILEVMAEKISWLETLARNLATNDVEVRLSHLLLQLLRQYGIKTNRGIEIEMPLTREEMSNYTGVTRETISRKLSGFQDRGIIKLEGNKKIIIIDEDKLEEYSS